MISDAVFPYPGGKSRAAEIVWQALRSVHSYVEPFCGSAAVFLARPKRLRFETLNDASGHVVNFLRAVKYAPDLVLPWTQMLRAEAELVACGKWLASLDLAAQLKGGLGFYDPVAAGCWAWYLSCSITVKVIGNEKQQPRLIRQGTLGDKRRVTLPDDLARISESLQDTRLLCGDWKACLGPANHQDSWHTDPVGVFFDPPYKGFECYNDGAAGIAADVAGWCKEHGADPAYRIVLCGYEGEHDLPGWYQIPWGTLGRVAKKRQEILWASPTCAD